MQKLPTNIGADVQEGFDMMEFLPHTKNKAFEANIKSGRFLQAVAAFKGKRPFDIT